MLAKDGIHEVYEGDVQYPCADIGAPELLHISAVTQENRKHFNYKCPGCGLELRPRLGRIAHCFAHRPGHRCDPDRYIHETAKTLIKERWERDEPSEVSYKVSRKCKALRECVIDKTRHASCACSEMLKVDLKTMYNRCSVEKKEGGFIPDICLYDDNGINDPLFIEIWSKHENSVDKRSSGYRIIELRFFSVEELEGIPKLPIVESDTITFTGFERDILFESCNDYLTKDFIKAKLKEKWESERPFEIIKNVKEECDEYYNCPFSQQKNGTCICVQAKSFNLKDYYNKCLTHYSEGNYKPDLCLTNDTVNRPPTFIEIGVSYDTPPVQSQHRIIRLRVTSVNELNALLGGPLKSSESVSFYNYKDSFPVSRKHHGPALYRYTLSRSLEKTLYDDVTCINYRSIEWDSRTVFEVICRQDSFPSHELFIEFCNYLAFQYQEIGICMKFTSGYMPPYFMNYSMRTDIDRYCRFYNIHGGLTEEFFKKGYRPQCFPELPNP